MADPVVAAIEALGLKIDALAAQMASWAEKAALHDYQPWAARMSQELYTVQDLDGDDRVFGHTFVIAETDQYPFILQTAKKEIDKKIMDQQLGGGVLEVLSARDYYMTLTDQRDQKAVKLIFGLDV